MLFKKTIMGQEKQSFFAKIMSILFIAMGIFLGMYAFFANATTWTIGTTTWDNMNYIDQTFWSTNPTSDDIIKALYGSGIEKTVYTQTRSGNNCNPTNLGVDYINPGLDTIPQQLSGNKIYILNSGDYKISYSSGIWMSGCSAILGSGRITIYSTGQLSTEYAIVYASGKQNIILDNINIDGKGDGNGGVHISNMSCILFKNILNSSLNTIQTYGTIKGIQLLGSTNTLINNIQSYNNINGIYLDNSSYNILNNIQTYNDTNGIYFYYGSNNSINNTQSYNNDNGIVFYGTTSNSLHNTQLYNNYEPLTFNASSNNVLHNITIYNANNFLIKAINSSNNNTYYGNFKIHGNNAIGTITTGGLVYSSLGRTSGTLITGGSMDCSRATNILNVAGSYLQDGPSSVFKQFCNIKNANGNRTGSVYTNIFGSNIAMQEQPIKRSGTNIVTYGILGSDYDTGRYIGQYGPIGGTFTINNNDISVYQNSVTLYTTITGASQMRFANSRELLSTAIWTNYTGIQTWIIDGTSIGIKSVYAEFSGINGIFVAMDTINYDGVVDNTPDQFSFTAITGAELNTLYTSNIVTLTGMSPNAFTTITVTYGILIKNGVNIGTSGTGGNGDQFSIAVTSNLTYNTTTSPTVSIGGITSSFSVTTKFADIKPDQFSFINKTGAELNTLYTSNIVTITGMSPGVSSNFSIVGSGTIIKNGINIGTSGTGANGDQFSIALTSSNTYSTAVSSTLTIGGTVSSYSLTTKDTPIGDYTPDQFSFTSITGAELNILYTSNIVTLTGMSPGVFTGISITNGSLIKNNINIGTSGTGGNGDQFSIILTSSNNYSTTLNFTIAIGGITSSFSVTTKTAPIYDYTPDQFSFISITGAELNILYTSNIVTLTGMSPGVFTGISITNGSLIKNNINIGTSGTGANGDQFSIVLTSSNNYATTLNFTIAIGGMTSSFSVTTKDNPALQIYQNFVQLTGTIFSGISTIIPLPYLVNSSSGSITIPQNIQITASGSTWDGVVLSPLLALGNKQATINETGLSSINTIYTTIEAGSTGTNLIANGGLFTLKILVNSGLPGQNLKIFRSNYNDGATWAVNTPDATCILDSNKYCTFTTDHLSLFTVGVSAIIWDNSKYLSGAFWNAVPSSADIIKAIYGSGDEGSAYTQGWTGYNSGSCLSGGMTVIYTGIIPTTLSDHTIYVINSGIYNVNTPIVMNNCNALISSGIVTLSGNVGLNPTLSALGKQNIIIEKIRIRNNNSGGSIYITGSTNICLNEIKTYATHEGIVVNNSSYGKIRNIESYTNILAGLNLDNDQNIIVDTISTHDNQHGIWIFASSGITLTGVTSYNNAGYGLILTNTDFTTLHNGLVYDNNGIGIGLSFAKYTTLDTIDSHDNIGHNLYLDTSYGNNLKNIVANGSQTSMGVNLYNSSGNILSGITAIGNYYAGIHFYNSSYNTGIHITANNNEGGIYLYNSLHNSFTSTSINSNLQNGVVVISGSNYNMFSGLVSSGNMDDGVYYLSSDYTTINQSVINNNAQYGIRIESGNNNTILASTINNNDYLGIYLDNSHINTIYGCTLSGSSWSLIGLRNSYNNQIVNTVLQGNNDVGIYTDTAHNTLISGTILSFSGYNRAGIYLYESPNSIISNSSYYYGGSNTYQAAISLINSTGVNIQHFLGTGYIYEEQYPSTFQYTLYDTYTQINNYISLNSYFSATLTGNTLAVGNTFVPYFDKLSIGNYGSIDLSGTSLWTIHGSAWDGKIYGPTYVTTGNKKANLGETGTALLTQIIDTIEVGATGTSVLDISGGTTTLWYSSSNGYSGQYLKILKSTDGETWTDNTAQSACILDEYSECSFITTGTLKLFALGVPGLFFTGTTQSGTLVQSGRYYTTGITISFTGYDISGHTLNGVPYTGGTLITGDGNYSFLLSNTQGSTTGITFTIDKTNPIVTGNLPASGTVFSTTSNIVFTWAGNDTNMSGYTLYITGTQIQNSTTTGTTTTVSLINGTYTWYVLATDRAGNTNTSAPATFTIITPFLPTITLLTGNLQYTTVRYTKDYASIYLRTNKLANYIFTGDFTTPTPPFMGTGFNGGLTGAFTLTSGDGPKNIYLQSTDGITTTGKIFTVYLDTTAPSIPVLTSPLSGALSSGAFSLMWATASDTGVGLSGYQYFVSTTGTIGIGTGIIISGYTSSTITSANIANIQLGTSGTFYRYVKAMDKLGNTAISTIQPFTYTGIIDTIPNQFTLNTITNAMTNRIYGSNTITITGLSANTPVLASINKGVLYISGNMVGTTGYVQNGWTVKIELVSSSDYDTLVSSILTIGGITSTFRITTETEADANNDDINYDDITSTLSSTTKLQINAIFKALRDLYAGTKQDEFLTSFMIMLQSKIDDLGTSSSDVNERKALQYMYDLIDNYGGNNGTNTTTIPNISQIKNGVYTAPNGKKYTITYNSTKKQFTSPNFITPKYFVTWDSFKYFIDINNPAGSKYLNAKAIKARWGRIALDGTRQTSPYTAPNHKVFYFFKTMEGQFSSYTFTSEKYFDSLEAVKEYIHNNNK